MAEAEEQLQSAQAALDKAAEPPKASEVVAQETAVEAARRKIDDEIANAELSRAENAAAVDASIMALNAYPRRSGVQAVRPGEGRGRARSRGAQGRGRRARRRRDRAGRSGSARGRGVQARRAQHPQGCERRDRGAGPGPGIARSGERDARRARIAARDPRCRSARSCSSSVLPATVNTLSAEVGEPVGSWPERQPVRRAGLRGSRRARDVGAPRRGARGAVRRRPRSKRAWTSSC